MRLLPLAFASAALVALVGCGDTKPPAANLTTKDVDPPAGPPAFDPLAPVHALIAAIEPHWNPPGKPDINKKWEPPSAVTSFERLYSENCQGCHGQGDKVAGSIALDNPMYLAVISEPQLLSIITNGVPHTGMPAFTESKGGLITEQQIDILAKGIKAWSSRHPAPTGPLPPYSAPLGNPQAGLTAFGVSCASCHGADGKGVAGKAGSVVDPAYLGMASDQYLRTITIAGRNDLGCPDFQHRVPNRAMTNEEISDVVAWLASQRKNEFGKPLSSSQP